MTYDPLAVAMIKVIVPSYARSWNPIRREWLIEAVYGKPLRDEMVKLGATIIGILVEAKKVATTLGRSFNVVLRTAPIVERILDVSGVLPLLNVAPTVEQALA